MGTGRACAFWGTLIVAAQISEGRCVKFAPQSYKPHSAAVSQLQKIIGLHVYLGGKSLTVDIRSFPARKCLSEKSFYSFYYYVDHGNSKRILDFYKQELKSKAGEGWKQIGPGQRNAINKASHTPPPEVNYRRYKMPNTESIDISVEESGFMTPDMKNLDLTPGRVRVSIISMLNKSNLSRKPNSNSDIPCVESGQKRSSVERK